MAALTLGDGVALGEGGHELGRGGLLGGGRDDVSALWKEQGEPLLELAPLCARVTFWDLYCEALSE